MSRNNAKNVVPVDTTSPTLSTESVLITSTIDAHEEQDVRIYDITSVFLGSDLDEDIKMQLCGRLAELMVNIEPQIYR